MTAHRVEPDAVEFAVPDPEHELQRVSLAQELRRPRLGPPLEWADGAWRGRFARPEVDRIEYLLEVDGDLQPDPANPLRAPGPFGDKSVIEWPEYEPPAWLDTIADPGPTEWIEIRSPRLVARVRVLLYSTPDPPPTDAPMLVVHDGPEYAEYSSLTRFLDAMSWEEQIPPMRAALVQPIDRNETYSASAQYAAALAREIIPALERQAPHGVRIGMGASLGALAMLHAHKRHQRAFDGLFLQSGSFFRQRWDAHESGFERYRRITRFVGTVLRGSEIDRPIPVAITVGTGEENRENNRAVAGALESQGYTAWLAEVRDGHNWTCWRDAFAPHLPALIEAAS
ncbi:MAG TPA: alpha/beta hydrolase-fold protein [Gaiellaceae bacterium]|nr:alpha/beta hydrolase-fold protein [Gaiellaceae bacterium]